MLDSEPTVQAGIYFSSCRLCENGKDSLRNAYLHIRNFQPTIEHSLHRYCFVIPRDWEKLRWWEQGWDDLIVVLPWYITRSYLWSRETAIPVCVFLWLWALFTLKHRIPLIVPFSLCKYTASGQRIPAFLWQVYICQDTIRKQKPLYLK